MNREWALLDTSLWINLIKGKVNKDIQEAVERLLIEGRVVLTPMIKLELLQGADTEEEYRKQEEYLNALPLLSLTEGVWQTGFRLAFTLHQKRLSIPSWDVLIASTAIHYDCTLMHSDKDFETIARNSSLKSRFV